MRRLNKALVHSGQQFSRSSRPVFSRSTAFSSSVFSRHLRSDPVLHNLTRHEQEILIDFLTFNQVKPAMRSSVIKRFRRHYGSSVSYSRPHWGELRKNHQSEAISGSRVSWKTRNPEFRRNSVGILKILFFVRLKSSRRLSEVRIFSKEGPRATEGTRASPTSNRTAKGVPKIFRLICM